MGLTDQLHAPAALFQGKQPQYPMYRMLSGPQNRSGRYAEQKNILPLSGTEPRLIGRPARSWPLYLQFHSYRNQRRQPQLQSEYVS
jgi:hypothetical protein